MADDVSSPSTVFILLYTCRHQHIRSFQGLRCILAPGILYHSAPRRVELICTNWGHVTGTLRPAVDSLSNNTSLRASNVFQWSESGPWGRVVGRLNQASVHFQSAPIVSSRPKVHDRGGHSTHEQLEGSRRGRAAKSETRPRKCTPLSQYSDRSSPRSGRRSTARRVLQLFSPRPTITHKAAFI